MHAILRVIYDLLYHPFAWSYDLVAGFVSFGQWIGWVEAIIPLVQGSKVLELGFGPGHLQMRLVLKGFQVYGLDESPQMTRQASRRLRRNGTAVNLVRGLSQNLPFDSLFDTVVATFPSEYIFDPKTMGEISRVLLPEGRLIILLSVSPGNPNSRSVLVKWLSDSMWLSENQYFKRRREQICILYRKKGIQMDTTLIPHGAVSLLILCGEKGKLPL
jgi:ubiquinone/menaquinone biosynthesis C-methylase UbiE